MAAYDICLLDSSSVSVRNIVEFSMFISKLRISP